jgi:hypothetical protein
LSSQDEIILAQEQSVLRRDSSGKKVDGTLILTDRRLLFVEANKEENLTGELGNRSATLRFADVEDLKELPSGPYNLSIPLDSITSVSGSEGIFHTPDLKVSWKSDSAVSSAEFTEDIIGGRKKDLKDWAKVIQSLKSGKIMIQRLSNPPPSTDSLEGKILHVLGDMQEKGTFEIEEEVETEFKLDLDIDQIEQACEKLASLGLVIKNPDSSGDVFYRKRSPLGEDDLSS